MEPFQKQMLTMRRREATRRFPVLGKLRKKLLSMGGEELVIDPLHPEFNALQAQGLLLYGQEFGGKSRLTKLEPNRCHENASVLFRRDPHCVSIGTGWALSNDGLWRTHSWAIDKKGLIETTSRRVKYFGLVLSGGTAEMFASNYLPAPGDAPVTLRTEPSSSWSKTIGVPEITLTAKVRTLLLTAVRTTGTYQPSEALSPIEESLTRAEHKIAYGFLQWLHTTGNKFGHSNIDEMFEKFLAHSRQPSRWNSSRSDQRP
jgi:hypothetical protein